MARERARFTALCALLSGGQAALTPAIADQAAIILTAMATSTPSRRQSSLDWLAKTQALLFAALAFTAYAQVSRRHRRTDGERTWMWIGLIYRACPADPRPDLAAQRPRPGHVFIADSSPRSSTSGARYVSPSSNSPSRTTNSYRRARDPIDGHQFEFSSPPYRR